MLKRKINGILTVLAALNAIGSDEITMFKLQELTKIRNYNTLNRAVSILKEVGFIEERYERGPPVRRFIKLTEKGRRAAQLAKELLELAGEL